MPVESRMLGRAREENITASITQSWKLARALALAANHPIFWILRDDGRSTLIQIDAGDDSFDRIMSFPNWAVQLTAGPVAISPGYWRVRIDPHGLSESVSMRLRRDDVTMVVDLPGIVDEPAILAAPEVK
jgi:hypothetical protein